MKRVFLLMVIAFIQTNFVFAQTYNIQTENGNTITTCSGNFVDSGVGSFGDYGNNEDFTVTFCSGSGEPLRFYFGSNFEMHPGDTLFLYDGIDTSGDLIVSMDNTYDFGFSQLGIATTSTCVTWHFVSNGSTTGNWSGSISCESVAPCNGNPPAADVFGQATFICNLNGYCGNTGAYYDEDRPFNLTGGGDCPSPLDNLFGGTLENNSWLSFEAAATSIDLDFVVSNCAGDGIQVGVFSFDGNSFTLVSPCSNTDGSWGGSFTVSATGLTIGDTYYIMVDGNTGANCDYTIYTDENSIEIADAGADQTICIGDDVNLTASAPGSGNIYTWTWDDGAGGPVVGANQTFTPAVTTEYVVSLSGDAVCTDVTDTVLVTVDACGDPPCGTCTTPDCDIAGPYTSGTEANLPFNHCSAMNLLPTSVSNTTYTSYHTISTGPDGSVGLIVSVGTTQLVGFTCDVTKTALLYPADPCTPGTAIAPSVINPDGAITFYNPEWYGLAANTTYILEITFDIPSECELDDHCESYYVPATSCDCSSPCITGEVKCFDQRVYDPQYETTVNAGVLETLCYTVNSGPNGFIGVVQQVLGGTTIRSAELFTTASCAGGMAPSVANANGVGSGFNPEWTGLTPNTDYVLCITIDNIDFMSADVNAVTYWSPTCCDADAGTYSIFINAVDVTDPSNEYILCDQDIINITSNGDETLPDPATGTPSAIVYGLYSCVPTSADPANDNPGCFNNETIELGESLPYTNDGGSNDPFIQWMATSNPLTDNTFWVVPITADWADDYSNWNWDADVDGCYDLGTHIKITYLNPIVVTPTEDCATGEVSLMIEGGSPEFVLGDVYTITNTGSGSLSSTTLNSSGGAVIISGLNNGDNYSISITDSHGCVQTFSAGPFTSCACSADAGTVTVLIDGVDVTNPSNQYTVCWGQSIDFVSDNNYILPPAASSDPTGLGYALWSSSPTNPDPTANAGYLGYDYNSSTGDINNGTGFPVGTFYIAAVTFDDVCNSWPCDGGIGHDVNGDLCYDVGVVMEFTFLNPIVVTPVEDCANGEVSITIEGGSLEYFPADSYTITNTGSGSLSATTLGTSGGSVIISGLNNGDSYSISISDGQSCIQTFSGGPFLSCACNADAGTVSVFIDGIDVTNPSNQYVVCWGQSIDFITDNNYVLPLPASSDPTGLGYALWSSNPTNPDPTANPGYLGYDYNSSTGDINNGTGFPVGTFYIAAVTFDDVCNSWPCDGGIGHDVNGDLCYDVGVVMEFTFLPAVVADAGLPDAICNGESTTLTASGANTYQWNNGATQGGSVSPTTTTIYTVTATDDNGCTDTDNVTITVNTLPTANAGTDQAVCDGQNVTLTATGGTSYSWDNGVTQGVAFSPASTTTYTVTVTDGNTCTDTDQVLVTVNALPIPNAGTDQAICQGQSTSLTATGGATYNWNNGITQSVPFTPAASTTYTVTVTDANNCQAFDQVNVVVNPLPTADAGLPQSICNGGSVILTATGGTAYTWDNGVTQSVSFTPTTTTTYNVTVTDANNCENTDQVTVTVNAAPLANAGTDQSICNGESVTLTASGGTTYTWDNGATQGVPFVPTTTLIYTVTVSDGSSCEATDQVTVTVNSIPVANAGADQNICYNSTTTLTASGGTSYLWSTNETTSSINVSPVVTTTYYLTVTENTCVDYDTVIVNVAPDIVADINATLSTVCQGDTAILTASGGTSYVWSTGSILQSISVAPGISTIYTVTVSDNGCFDEADISITVNDSISITASPAGICAGESTVISVSGGSVYIWDTGDTTQTITVSPTVTTTYYVTVGESGCYGNGNITVSVSSLPNVSAGSDQIICNGESANLIASGGIDYLWSTSQTTSFITVSPNTTTTYIVTVTDDNCSAIDDVQVTVNPLPMTDAGADISICEGESTVLTASGGTTYVWDDGSSTQSVTVSPTSTTTYTVTAYINGCSAIDDVTITVNSLPNADAGENTGICEGETTTLTATGGTSYYWSTSSSNQSIDVSPPATSWYYVTVTQTSCSSIDSVLVTKYPPVTASITATLSAVCTNQSSILNATGGTYYLWSTGQNTQSITVSPPVTTIYTVTVTNNNNCEDIAQIEIMALPAVTASSSPSEICIGESTVLTVSSGDTYIWSTGETIQTITVSPTVTTTYYVTVTENGCTDSASVPVTVNSLPNSVTIEDQVICDGESISLTTNGGSQYYWSNTMTGSSINVSPLTSTIYYVTIVSSAGCSTEDTIQVDVNPTPVASTNEDQSICEGDNVKLTGYGGLLYEWSPSSSLDNNTSQFPTASPTTSTTYTVTVTNEYGCTDTDNVFVEVSQAAIVEVLVQAMPDPSVCFGESLDFTAAVINGGQTPVYNWTVNGLSVGINSNTYASSSLTDGSIVGCTVTSSAGCVLNNPAEDFVEIEVYDIPEIFISYLTYAPCVPATVEFQNPSSETFQTYNWEFTSDEAVYFSSSPSPVITLNEAGYYDVSLTVTSTYGCTNSLNFNNLMVAFQVPDAMFYATPTITSILDPIIQFDNNSTGADYYLWDLGDGTYSYNENVEHEYENTGTFTVTLHAQTLQGCVDSVSLDIIINPEYTFYAPTAFCPGPAGQNSLFSPKGTGIDLDRYELYIYDRWGEIIYQSDEYDVSYDGTINVGWDGTSKRGMDVPVGVYTWMAIYYDTGGNAHQESGAVTVIR